MSSVMCVGRGVLLRETTGPDSAATLRGKHLGSEPMTPTADQLNAHLASGGHVVIGTCTRGTHYKPRHAGMFSQGADGNLYVQHGRGRNCLTMSKGRTALVAIRMGHPNKTTPKGWGRIETTTA